jgi:hypothetical protein
LKKFYRNPLLILLFLFSNLSLVAAASNVGLNVIDTILGEDTFYSFEATGGVELEGEYTLALRNPDLSISNLKVFEFDEIDWLSPYRIDDKFLSVAGRYDLFVLKEGERFSEIVLRDEFFVKESVTNKNSDVDEESFTKWLQANVFGIGGDETMLAQAEMNRFDIEDLPVSVEVQSPISFTVKALNSAQEDDLNYTGTIKIEVLNDVNAVTPNDYTFVLQDAGEHRFVDSLIFNSVGSKTLKVTDVDNEDITAEFNVEVVDSDATEDDTLLQIESPTSTVYSESRVLVQGQTEPGLEVIVRESGAEFYRFDAEVDGSFSELLPPIEDGIYSFQFQVNDTITQPVSVEINTGGVSIRDFSLSSEEVMPVELVDVDVELNSSANSVSVIVNGIKTDMQKDDVSGFSFSGQITAPVSTGNYPINLVIVDDLGNSSSIESGKSLLVSNSSEDDLNSADGLPSRVTGVTGESMDKQVMLSWNASNDDTGVRFYSIRYGLSAGNLNTIVDTTSNATEWYIPNLVNDQNYYFQVYAVDTDGNESALGSEVVSITPGRPDSTSLLGSADAESTSETGPGLLFAAVIALVLSFGGRLREKLSFKRN